MIISGQIWGSKLQSVFTLGDGCWLPKGGGQSCFIFAVLGTLFSCSPMSPFYLKTCSPMKGTPLKHRLRCASFLLHVQEPRKGVLAKGVFCRIQHHTRENKQYPKTFSRVADLAPRAPRPREAYILQTPPLLKTKSPFSGYKSRALLSGISKPVVRGTRGLHPRFSWFSSILCGFRDFR